ncbi:MAG: cation:proton antiporter [Proteobacteria bacterium]|nr:cation:proton antiporter [Pseudomonadota bacterium]
MFQSIELILILLVSSVAAVAVFRYLRISSTIAYFFVGLLLGPFAFGLLPNTESVKHFVEFGIVFLMFTIGLEFSLPKLNSMRKIIFGLGAIQVVTTILTTMAISRLFNLNFGSAFIIGSAFSLSSTAIVLKILVERIDLNSRHGKLATGILLFQDLAVIPILILIPAISSDSYDLYTISGLIFIKVLILFTILFWLGKPILNFWFGIVAKQKSRELFVLNVLMITLIFSYLTNLTGLSYALGAFIAGMLISETRYRYQVESDIASFRDILLGLFFISIGMMLNISIFIDYLFIIIAIFTLYTFFKVILISVLTKIYSYEWGVGLRVGIILGQAGEFSFVVLSLGNDQGLLTGDLFQIILSTCLLSMLVSPFLIPLNGKIARFLSKNYLRNSQKVVANIEDTGKVLNDHVILCGFGRSGQYLARFLKEESVLFIAIDMDLNRVNDAASAGELVMYGDASRRVVLKAAGIAKAKAIVITYADDRASSKVLHVIRDDYPDLPVIVRTADDSTIVQLQNDGASEVIPEVLEGSLMLASQTLLILGIPLKRIIRRIREFREERYKMFRGYFKGSTDIDDDINSNQQLELHSEEISHNSFILGHKLSELQIGDIDVEVQYLRRPNMLENIDPRPDIVLGVGDIIVILGTQPNISKFHKYAFAGSK